MLGGQNIIDSITRLTCFLICTSMCWRATDSQRTGQGIGPTECEELTARKFGEQYLMEFPTNDDYDFKNGLNFLEFGDGCNANAQTNFRAELKMKFDELRFGPGKNSSERSAGNIWSELDKIWNKWRTNAADGEAGTRVCNPRRLLGCHGTLKICVCLQDFTVGTPGDREYNEDHRVILARPDWEIVINHDKVVNRTVCKAVEGSFCDWEVPWLFFCQIPCLGGEGCIGQLGALGRKICRPCNTPDKELCSTDEHFYPKFFKRGSATTSPVEVEGNATRLFCYRIGILFVIVCFTKIW